MPGAPIPHDQLPAGVTCALSRGPMDDETRAAVEDFRQELRARAEALDAAVRPRDEHGVRVLQPTADLDVYFADKLRQATVRAENFGHYQLVLDLAGVAIVDSTGLGVLVGARNRALKHGGWLALAAISEQVRRTLTTTGLTKVFPIGDTVEQAVTVAREWHP